MNKKTPIAMGKVRRQILRWIRDRGPENKFTLEVMIRGIGWDPDNTKDHNRAYNGLRGIREAILSKYMYYTLLEPDLLKHVEDEEEFYSKVLEYLHSYGIYLTVCNDDNEYFEPTFDDLQDYQNKHVLRCWKTFYSKVKRSHELKLEMPSGRKPAELMGKLGGVEEGYMVRGGTVERKALPSRGAEVGSELKDPLEGSSPKCHVCSVGDLKWLGKNYKCSNCGSELDGNDVRRRYGRGENYGN
ncbi:MAG: hypothetical protein V1934_01005 [Methanobacteriota archaeon]